MTVALALFAQTDHFGPGFRLAAIALLAVLLITGLSTYTRLQELNRDDIRWVRGMNRLRRAYVEAHPSIEPYLITGTNDDAAATMRTMGLELTELGGRFERFAHGVSTLPPLLAALNGVVFGALTGLLVGEIGLGFRASIVVAVAAGLILFVALSAYAGVRFRRYMREMDSQKAG